MNVLLLNQYYPPDTSATSLIARDLVGVLTIQHDVTVVCGRPSYAPAEHHPYYLLRQEIANHTAVQRVGSSSFHRRTKLGRLANYLSFLFLSLVRVITIRPRPDVIITMTDPPILALVGAIGAILRGSRFIYNIRDLHPDMALAAGFILPRPVWTIWEKLHDWALLRAHLVIVLGDDMKDRIVAKGVTRKRVVVVRDGAWPMHQPTGGDSDVVQAIRGDSEFVLLHAGNLGFAGDWDTLVSAAPRLRSAGIRLAFVGDGAQKEQLQLETNGLSNVVFLPFFPPDDIPSVFASADMHVVTIKSGVEGLVVPSKLYPILMAGKPVLVVASANSDAARIVESSGCGIVVAPGDVEGLVTSVQELTERPDLLAAMSKNAREISQSFTRDKELSRYVSFVEASGGIDSLTTEKLG